VAHGRLTTSSPESAHPKRTPIQNPWIKSIRKGLKAKAFNPFYSKKSPKKSHLGIPMPENGIGVQYRRGSRPWWVFSYQFLAGLTSISRAVILPLGA
jgi:hypothetical protein